MISFVPLILLSTEEEAGFAREQRRSACGVTVLTMFIMMIPNCYNASLTWPMLLSFLFPCSAIVAVRYLLGRMKDQDRAMSIFTNYIFYLATLVVIPVCLYELVFSLPTPTICADVAFEEEIAGAIGFFGYVLVWLLGGFPWWQRFVVLVATACLIVVASVKRGCAGRVFLVANAIAMALGLLVNPPARTNAPGLDPSPYSIECPSGICSYVCV